jgi:hypothetical protein
MANLQTWSRARRPRAPVIAVPRCGASLPNFNPNGHGKHGSANQDGGNKSIHSCNPQPLPC